MERAIPSGLVTFVLGLIFFGSVPSSADPTTSIPRRSFLKTCIAAVSGIGIGRSLGSHTEADQVVDKSQSFLPEPVINVLPSDSHFTSAVETVALQMGSIAARRVANIVSPELASLMGGASVHLDQNEALFLATASPLSLMGDYAVATPLMEEAWFRLIPQTLFGTSWWVGVPSTLAFGFIHNLYTQNGSLQIQSTIPVTQLVLGAEFWHLAATRGYSHAVVGHMAANAWPMLYHLSTRPSGD